MFSKYTVFLCLLLSFSWVNGQPSTLPTDTTTFFTDSTCYINPVQKIAVDTIVYPYLIRIATLRFLYEQTLSEIKDTINPFVEKSPSTGELNISADSLTKSQTLAVSPPQLWYQVKNLPEFTDADIKTTYNIQPIRKAPESKTFLFYVFLGIAFIYAYLLNTYANYMNKLRESAFNIYIARQFYKDFNHTNLTLNILLFFLPICVLGLFVYLAVTFFDLLTQTNDFLLLSGLIIGVGAYLFFHRLVLLFLAFILPLSESINFFLFNTKLLNIVFCFFLFPVLLFLAFGSYWVQSASLYLSLVILFLFIGFLFYRGVSIVKEFIWQYKFHFFLYLCALEIAPVLVIIKVATKYLA